MAEEVLIYTNIAVGDTLID